MNCLNVRYLILLIFLITYNSYGQKILYHEFSPTASDWDIIKWNTKKNPEKDFILKEYVDEKGRVTGLEFLKDNKPFEGYLCYLPDKVTFEYYDNKIVETLYQSNEFPLATDCEMWYKSIYHLNKDNTIEFVERFSKFDFSGMNSDEIKKLKEYLQPEYYLEKADSENSLQIEYYYYSFSKMNGIYPVSKNYIFDENDEYFENEPERSSIKQSLK